MTRINFIRYPLQRECETLWVIAQKWHSTAHEYVKLDEQNRETWNTCFGSLCNFSVYHFRFLHFFFFKFPKTRNTDDINNGLNFVVVIFLLLGNHATNLSLSILLCRCRWCRYCRRRCRQFIVIMMSNNVCSWLAINLYRNLIATSVYHRMKLLCRQKLVCVWVCVLCLFFLPCVVCICMQKTFNNLTVAKKQSPKRTNKRHTYAFICVAYSGITRILFNMKEQIYYKDSVVPHINVHTLTAVVRAQFKSGRLCNNYLNIRDIVHIRNNK